MIQLSDSNFEALKSEPGIVVIRATAPWCGPCKVLKPIFQELEQELTSVKFAELTIDDCPAVTDKLEINSIPTIFFYKDGTLVNTVKGAKPKSYFEGIIKNL